MSDFPRQDSTDGEFAQYVASLRKRRDGDDQAQKWKRNAAAQALAHTLSSVVQSSSRSTAAETSPTSLKVPSSSMSPLSQHRRKAGVGMLDESPQHHHHLTQQFSSLLDDDDDLAIPGVLPVDHTVDHVVSTSGLGLTNLRNAGKERRSLLGMGEDPPARSGEQKNVSNNSTPWYSVLGSAAMWKAQREVAVWLLIACCIAVLAAMVLRWVLGEYVYSPVISFISVLCSLMQLRWVFQRLRTIPK